MGIYSDLVNLKSGTHSESHVTSLSLLVFQAVAQSTEIEGSREFFFKARSRSGNVGSEHTYSVETSPKGIIIFNKVRSSFHFKRSKGMIVGRKNFTLAMGGLYCSGSTASSTSPLASWDLSSSCSSCRASSFFIVSSSWRFSVAASSSGPSASRHALR